MSRVGHFTCPVATGAVLLGQHPALPGSSGGGCGSSGGSSAGDSAAQMQAALLMKHDPMVSALDNMTSYEDVLQVGVHCLLALRPPPHPTPPHPTPPPPTPTPPPPHTHTHPTPPHPTPPPPRHPPHPTPPTHTHAPVTSSHIVRNDVSVPSASPASCRMLHLACWRAVPPLSVYSSACIHLQHSRIPFSACRQAVASGLLPERVDAPIKVGFSSSTPPHLISLLYNLI